MLWLYLLAVVLLGAVVAALLGRWDGAAVPREESGLGESDVDELLQRRSGKDLTADDLQEVRLDSAVRGYRMDQVDRLLDALAQQLAEADHSLAERDLTHHDDRAERSSPEHPQDSSQPPSEADSGSSQRRARTSRDSADKPPDLPARSGQEPESPQME